MTTPDSIVLSCGCLIDCVVENDERILKYSACKDNCSNFQTALQLAQEKGKPVTYKVV